MRPQLHLSAAGACLASVLAVAAPAQQSAVQAFQDLTQQFEEAQAGWRAKLKAFGDNADYQRLRKEKKYREAAALRDKSTRRPYLDFLPKFEAAAKQCEGKPEEVLFLAWMVNAPTSKAPPQPSQQRALKRLLTTHLRSPHLQGMVTAGENASMYQTLGFDEFIAVLGKVAKGSPHKLVQANALYCRALFQLDIRKWAKKGDPLTEDQEQSYYADMARVAELAPGTSLALRAAAAKFEKEHLQVGMVAPDIAGEDLDGVRFRLSDYRGKVVVLDFWGDW